MANHSLTRRTVLGAGAVASLAAVEAAAASNPAAADERSTANSTVDPRVELLGASDLVSRSGDQIALPRLLGVRVVVGTREIPVGARLRFVGLTDSYDVVDAAVLGSVTTGFVSDLSVRIEGEDQDVVVTVSTPLESGGEYTVVLGTTVGERYPHRAPGQDRAGSARLETASGVVLASTMLTGEANAEARWAVSIAYSADTTGGSSAPTGWVTVHSAGSGPIPNGGEILVLLDRAHGRPGLSLGRAGASRSDSSRPADIALARRSGGAATYKIRIDDPIPAGKSIVIPVSTPDDGAPIRAIEYRPAPGASSGQITGAESVEVLAV